MSRANILVVSLVIAWVGAAAYFYVQMMRFDSTPGTAAQAPVSWPTKGHLALSDDRPTLLMFLHPKCNCSRASLTILSELQSEFPKRFHTVLAVWQPLDASAEWSQVQLPDDRALSDYRIIQDKGGVLAAEFDAHTSGQTLVYDTHGKLRFAGGVTSYRGGSDGPGAASLRAVLNGHNEFQASAVFGCGF